MSFTPVGMYAVSGSGLPLQWIATNLGNGYGNTVVGLDGNTYVQTYPRTIKLDKNGKTQWAYEFSGSSNKYAIDIDGSENVFLAGYNSFVASFDTAGNLRWQRFVGSGINWFNLAMDPSFNSLYVVGKDASNFGHVVRLNATDGSVIWARRTTSNMEFYGVAVAKDASRVSAIGMVSVSGILQAHYIEMNVSNGATILQRRLSISGTNVIPQAVAFSGSHLPVVSGWIGNRLNFLVGFNSSGNATFSLRTSGNNVYSDFGTVAYDAEDFLYLSHYNLRLSPGPSAFDQWGPAYTRFLGSTPQQTVSFLGTSGTLRMAASRVDRAITLAGLNHVIKVLGDSSVQFGAQGAFTLYDVPGLDYIGSGISISTDSVSYTNSGITSSVSSYSVVPVSAVGTITYLK